MKKYLKVFQYHEDYVEYKSSDSFLKPNVSECINEGDIHYNKKVFNPEYFTLETINDCVFTISINSGVTTNEVQDISYSTDNGETWLTTPNVSGRVVTITTPQIAAGNKVLVKGNATAMAINTNKLSNAITGATGATQIGSTGEFNVRGNIMSLLYNDDFADKETLPNAPCSFACLFFANTNIISAKNLFLPSSEFTADNCYSSMFEDCTNLTSAPKLPATTLANKCYSSMFKNCGRLTTAPELPATTLADYCYQYMFSGCTSLTTAPELPATTLGTYCYQYMFYNCTSLTVAPELPATTLVNYCYQYMFVGCTNLTTAPELPATTLATQCYRSMFKDCTNLTSAPELSTTELVSGCYYSMFQGCTSLTVAPELPATTLVERCYYNMFYSCTNLNLITCLATNISATNCTNNWVSGVASSGTFYKSPSMTSWGSGASGTPTGWTVQNASS